MTPVDLDRLRMMQKLAINDPWEHYAKWNEHLHANAPALLDELEALRAERTAERCAVLRAVAEERAAIVAWLTQSPSRDESISTIAQWIRDGVHHADPGPK